MKPTNHRNQSRKSTPWDNLSDEEISPSQSFIKYHHQKHYEDRHPILKLTGESEVINSHIPACCPHCGSDLFVKNGFDKNGVQLYSCKQCRKGFSPVTGTIFDSHKISISEWIDYSYNLFAYVSLTAGSWNNRNSFTTSRYWLEKVFMLLEEYQKDIVLKGKVYLDETFYSVRISDLVLNPDGSKPRGLSENQICIGVACDSRRVYCVLEGYGKPSQDKTLAAFKDHIKKGSALVHDKDNSHALLMQELDLKDEAYDSSQLKKLPDNENPLNRVNQIHNLIKKFFYAHNSFNRVDIAGYINLFSFMMNPPRNKLAKVETLINLGFSVPKVLRYRDFYSKKE